MTKLRITVINWINENNLQSLNLVTFRKRYFKGTSIVDSNCPGLVTYHTCNLGSLDILLKSIQSCMCRYTLRKCCIAEPFDGGRLTRRMTPPFACLLFLHKRCMDNDVTGMLYMNWKINIPALPVSLMEVVSRKTYQWSVLTV